MTPQFILNAIKAEIAKIVDEETAKAAERVKARVASAAAGIAVNVLRQIRVESMGEEIVIRVDAKS